MNDKMIKIDLITGFLGAGKTAFIRKYAKYLIDSGKNIGVLENDFGADSDERSVRAVNDLRWMLSENTSQKIQNKTDLHGNVWI